MRGRWGRCWQQAVSALSSHPRWVHFPFPSLPRIWPGNLISRIGKERKLFMDTWTGGGRNRGEKGEREMWGRVAGIGRRDRVTEAALAALHGASASARGVPCCADLCCADLCNLWMLIAAPDSPHLVFFLEKLRWTPWGELSVRRQESSRFLVAHSCPGARPVWLPKVVEGWRAAREILHVLPQNWFVKEMHLQKKEIIITEDCCIVRAPLTWQWVCSLPGK